MIVDGDVHPSRSQSQCRFFELHRIVDRVDPEHVEVLWGEPEHLESHQGDVLYERKIPTNELREFWEALVCLLVKDDSQLQPDTVGCEVIEPLQSLVECALCLHDIIVQFRNIRVERNP